MWHLQCYLYSKIQCEKTHKFSSCNKENLNFLMIWGMLRLCSLYFNFSVWYSLKKALKNGYKFLFHSALWFDEKNCNKVFIQFRCRYVDDDSIQPRLRPVHWRFLDQDSPAKYGSSIFLSSAMLRNINSNPMPRYKNASEKSHHQNMHDEFRLLKVKRLSLTLSFIPKSTFDCEGCSLGPRNYFSK